MMPPEFVIDNVSQKVRDLFRSMAEHPGNACAVTTVTGPDGFQVTLFLADTVIAAEFVALLEGRLAHTGLSKGVIPRPN